MKVWMVQNVWSPHVSHGYEPMSLHTTEDAARARVGELEAENAEHRASDYCKGEVMRETEQCRDPAVFEVEEWEVLADPALVPTMASEPTPSYLDQFAEALTAAGIAFTRPDERCVGLADDSFGPTVSIHDDGTVSAHVVGKPLTSDAVRAIVIAAGIPREGRR